MKKYIIFKVEEDGMADWCSVHGHVSNPCGRQAVFEVAWPDVHPLFTVRPATL